MLCNKRYNQDIFLRCILAKLLIDINVCPNDQVVCHLFVCWWGKPFVFFVAATVSCLCILSTSFCCRPKHLTLAVRTASRIWWLKVAHITCKITVDRDWESGTVERNLGEFGNSWILALSLLKFGRFRAALCFFFLFGFLILSKARSWCLDGYIWSGLLPNMVSQYSGLFEWCRRLRAPHGPLLHALAFSDVRFVFKELSLYLSLHLADKQLEPILKGH